MFARTFFPARFFPPGYFPPVTAPVPPTPTTPMPSVERQLWCVVEDGEVPARFLPYDVHQIISLDKSLWVRLRLGVFTRSGRSVSAGGSIILQLMDCHSTVVHTEPASSDACGWYIDLDVRELVPQRYTYDIWLIDGDDRTILVPKSSVFWPR